MSKLISYACNLCGAIYSEEIALGHLYGVRRSGDYAATPQMVHVDLEQAPIHICLSCIKAVVSSFNEKGEFKA